MKHLLKTDDLGVPGVPILRNLWKPPYWGDLQMVHGRFCWPCWLHGAEIVGICDPHGVPLGTHARGRGHLGPCSRELFGQKKQCGFIPGNNCLNLRL